MSKLDFNNQMGGVMVSRVDYLTQKHSIDEVISSIQPRSGLSGFFERLIEWITGSQAANVTQAMQGFLSENRSSIGQLSSEERIQLVRNLRAVEIYVQPTKKEQTRIDGMIKKIFTKTKPTSAPQIPAIRGELEEDRKIAIKTQDGENQHDKSSGVKFSDSVTERVFYFDSKKEQWRGLRLHQRSRFSESS